MTNKILSLVEFGFLELVNGVVLIK